MDLSNIFNFVTNPAGAITSLAIGIITFHLYQIVKGILNPIEKLNKLYDFADKIILTIDDRVVDKFLPKKLKKEFQKDILSVLLSRKDRIDALVDKIKD